MDAKVDAAWQKGFPLEQLKALAAPFRERHKPLVFGAFGLTKERDVADALAAGRLLWTGKPPEAVAIAHVLKRDSEQQDFAQRRYVVPAGAVVVRAFAALRMGAGQKVLYALRDRIKGAPLVVEIFEEDTVARACMAAMPGPWFYNSSKISAGSEIKGVYSSLELLPAMPAEEWPALEVLEPAFLNTHDLVAVCDEADALGTFAQHYSDYNKRKSWTAFALHGYSDDPGFIIKPAEMAKSWKDEHPEQLAAKVRWTKAAERCPKTCALVKKLGLKLDRVRFMRLRSKDGELSRHADITDREAGLADGFVARLHVPIRTSAAVRFFAWTARGEKQERQLPEGALCYLDQRKPHAVKNEDPSLDRIHLVIDCFADEKLRGMVRRSVEEVAKPRPFVAKPNRGPRRRSSNATAA